jgi:hypothetical protein
MMGRTCEPARVRVLVPLLANEIDALRKARRLAQLGGRIEISECEKSGLAPRRSRLLHRTGDESQPSMDLNLA